MIIKQIPILFSTPMVQAILAGRKTMTRRPVKPSPSSVATEFNYNPISWPKRPWNARFAYDDTPIRYEITDSYNCPYGRPGDILWVRESFRVNSWTPDDGEVTFRYEADGAVSESVASDDEDNIVLKPLNK